MKKLGAKPGDLVVVPLPDGRHCIGRMYRDSTIGIHFGVTKDRADSAAFTKVPDLVAGVFTRDFKSARWKVCGNIPFETQDAAWAPPTFKRDILHPNRLEIYHRGVFRPATEKEAHGLHPALMYKPEQLAAVILERITAQG